MRLLHDVRYAARLLAKDPWFTGIAAITLALGIAVTSTFFTIVHAIVLRGPLADPGRIVAVGPRTAAGQTSGMSSADFDDLRSAVRSLEGLAAFSNLPVVLREDDGVPERVTAAYISADAFRLLRESPVLGRPFNTEDERPGAPATAILAADIWRARYANEPDVVGRSIRIDGAPVTVIGVMRDGFKFPNDTGVWLPLSSLPSLTPTSMLSVFGRLTDGITIAQTRAELDGIAGRLPGRGSQNSEGELRLAAVPINEQFIVVRLTDPAWLAFTLAGIFVLLIACANVANLLLGRSLRRWPEMTIRASLGASRRHIVHQLLAESALIAALGGFAGLLVSLAALRLISLLIPEGALPSWMHFGMDGRVFALLAATCVATTFVFGLVPALQTSKASVMSGASVEGRASSTLGIRRWSSALLAVQFALSFVLVTIVVEGIRSLDVRAETDLIIDSTGLLTTFVTLPPPRYPTPEARALFFERLLQDIKDLPDVSAAALTTALPFGGAPQQYLDIADREVARPDGSPRVQTVTVDMGYFDVLGAPLVQGQDVADEGAGSLERVIVNERFTRMFFPEGDAIGSRIRLLPQPGQPEGRDWLEIAGVSPNLPQGAAEAQPVVYRRLDSVLPATAALIVRGRTAAGVSAETIRDRVQTLDSELALYRTRTMEQVMFEAKWNPRVANVLAHAIAGIALLLAALGLYAVTAYGVTGRMRELGIRLALGARRWHVSWIVLRRVGFQLAIGLAAGLLVTVTWHNLLSNGQGSQTEPAILATAAAVVLLVSSAACLIPVRRATRIDPVSTLRCD